MQTDEAPKTYALASDEGEPIWIVGGLTSLKATAASTGGAMTVMEVFGREGMAVPLHTHADEDEAWYLVEGEVTLQIGDEVISGSAGHFAFIPRGTPHGFHLASPTARFLDIRTPGGFEGLFRAAGDPAPARELPPVGPPDVDRLLAAAPDFGMTVVGPPPAHPGRD